MLGFVCCLFSLTIWIVGIYTFLHAACLLMSFLVANFLRKPLNLEERYGKGTWAVVTGATAGIGEEFCKQLAKMNFNIVLIGRDKDKLVESEKKVKEANRSVKTQLVQADLGEELTPNFYKDIHSQIGKLDISIVVNNAGAGKFYPFHKTPVEEHMSYTRLNAGAPAMLTHTLLPQLLKRGKRSAVINVSSIVNNSPLPFSGVYAATKRFLTFFSYSLHDVYNNKIDVQDLTPGYVSTKMTNFVQSIDAISPEKCVRSSLRDLGHPITSVPSPLHSFVALVMRATYNFAKPAWVELVCKNTEMIALENFMTDNEEMKRKKKDD